MTRELIIESIWQTLCFNIPIRRTDFHFFCYAFLDGPKRFDVFSVDNERIGTIEESLYDFILNIENEKYTWMQKTTQENLNKIANLGREAMDDDRKAGKFREIAFNIAPPDYGLKDGDIINGWGHIV